MEGLVKYLDSIGRSVVLMAPTGRAAMVIGNKPRGKLRPFIKEFTILTS